MYEDSHSVCFLIFKFRLRCIVCISYITRRSIILYPLFSYHHPKMSSLGNQSCVRQVAMSGSNTTFTFATLWNNIGYYKLNTETKEKTLIGLIMVRPHKSSVEVPCESRLVRYKDQATGGMYPTMKHYKEPTFIKVHDTGANSSYQCIKQVDEQVDIIFANPSFYYPITVTVLNSTNLWNFSWKDTVIDGQVMKTAGAQVNPGAYSIMQVGSENARFGLSKDGLKAKDRYIAFNIKSHEPEKNEKGCVFFWEPVHYYETTVYNEKKMKSLNAKTMENFMKKSGYRNITSDKMGDAVVIKFDQGTEDFHSVTPDYVDDKLYPCLKQQKELKRVKDEEERKSSATTKQEEKESLVPRVVVFPCGHLGDTDKELLSKELDIKERECTYAECEDTEKNHYHLEVAFCGCCGNAVFGYMNEKTEADVVVMEDVNQKQLVSKDATNKEETKQERMTTSQWLDVQFGDDTYTKFLVVFKGKTLKEWFVKDEKVTTEVTKITKEEAAVIKDSQFVVKVRVNKVVSVIQGVTEADVKSCIEKKDFSSIVINHHDIDIFQDTAKKQLEMVKELKHMYIEDFSVNHGFSKVDTTTVYLPIYHEDAVTGLKEKLLKNGEEDVDFSKVFDEVALDGYKKICKAYDLPAEPITNKIIGISCDFVAFIQFVKPKAVISQDQDEEKYEMTLPKTLSGLSKE